MNDPAILQIVAQAESWLGSPLVSQSVHPVQAYTMIDFAGRYRFEQDDYSAAVPLFELAFEKSLTFTPEGDVCAALQLATVMDQFPITVDEANASLNFMSKHQQDFLQRSQQRADEDFLVKFLPGADQDPLEHCLLTLFTLSFYYRADTAQVAHNHYKMTVAAWPDLNWTSPNVNRYWAEQRSLQVSGTETPCIDRKIRLGIVSGMMTDGHSVSEDFGGVQQRLDRNLFNVTYIYVHSDKLSSSIATYTNIHGSDQRHVFHRTEEDKGKAAWVIRLGKIISKMDLDMILYLDLTMSTVVRRLGMLRLAPVQITSHGHPVTSGIETIDYFVSWAEAELELEKAQKHYTEKLILIPNGTLHQFYERRILPGQISRMDMHPYGSLKLSDFGLPSDRTLYLCMQKPFKMHPEHAELICRILARDTLGYMILHRDELEHVHKRFVRRLKLAGCRDTIDRVHFMPAQPHHRLLALYKYSTVILDSYPAGGCTTSREVLEMGKAIVTWPARLLGGRWTLGYLTYMQLSDEVKAAMIADSADQYVELAIQLGRNATHREKIEKDIKAAFPRLLQQDEAVDAWQKILLDLSPVQMCEDPARIDEL